MDKLSSLAEECPQRGFDEFYGIIRQQGYIWNRKRLLRIYRLMKLGLRRKQEAQKAPSCKSKGTITGSRAAKPYLEHGFYEGEDI